jgi:hypothetical protein
MNGRDRPIKGDRLLSFTEAANANAGVARYGHPYNPGYHSFPPRWAINFIAGSLTKTFA